MAEHADTGRRREMSSGSGAVTEDCSVWVCGVHGIGSLCCRSAMRALLRGCCV